MTIDTSAHTRPKSFASIPFSIGYRNGAYSAAADSPNLQHAFPVGRAFAESLGYPADLLDRLPCESVDAFAGVSNVSLFAELNKGMRVLDLGCGAGLDSLIASRRVGPYGSVVGMDFSSSMVERARAAAERTKVENVRFQQADAERLPLDNASFDAALVNGIFNLNPARDLVFYELARVLRPGGSAFVAELILSGPLPANVKQTEADWFA